MKRYFIPLLACLALLLAGCGETESTVSGGDTAPLSEEGTAAVADEDIGCSAWLCYWDAEAALQEAREHPENFESLICFEACFDSEGNWLLLPETEELLAEMRKLDVPVYLSLVNDVRQEDGSFVQKSRDFLAEELSTEASRSAHIAKIMQLVRATGVDGLELDYENFKSDTELWASYSALIKQLYGILSHNGVRLRVVMECRAPKYTEFPEGPVYSCMCYNLYGSHSGPGPKADKAFLRELGESWKSVPGEVHMAFASGGYLWAGEKAEKSLTEQAARQWLEQEKAKTKRDEDSGALTAVVRSDKTRTLWYADGETLALWRETLQAMGYAHFDLFRLGGNTEDSLSTFLAAP